ncbi:MAG TPA: SDR family NAD(P)-dependent oxidoreductase [Fimbriimonas sp.]
MKKYGHAIVVGASSGLGAEIARQLAATGCRVAAVARRAERLESLARESANITIYPHDATDYASVPLLFQRIAQEIGGLDLVVFAAGVMPEVAVGEYDFEKDRQIVEVNVLGAVAWLNEAALRFQSTGHGTIVGIGSVAGDRGRMKQPVYNASKAFLHTYLEALRNRVARHGVTVVTIKPGPMDTEMTAGMHLRSAMSAEEAARRTLARAETGGEKYLSAKHRLAFAVIKRIPSWIFRRLNV